LADFEVGLEDVGGRTMVSFKIS